MGYNQELRTYKLFILSVAFSQEYFITVTEVKLEFMAFAHYSRSYKNRDNL